MPVGAQAGPPPTSSSAGCGSSAAGCRCALECRPGVRLRPRPVTRRTVSEHGARFDGPGLSPGAGRLGAARPRRGGRDRRLHPRRGRERHVRPAAHRRRTAPPAAARGPGRPRTGSARRSPTGGAGSARCTYRGRWREVVQRSALALKLLTFEPTGAIVAAPTTSLPEGIGGGAELGLPLHLDPRRRLHPLRLPADRLHRGGDAVHGLAGRPAGRRASRHCAGPLQLMYGVDGRSDLAEEELTHLEGYRGSRPVRIGNGAHVAAPARHLRRADGLGLPAQQVRRPGRLRRLVATSGSWSTGCATTGAGRTRGSGRSAAAGGTSSTRSSCAGWRSTAGCGWPTSGPSRPTGRSGSRPATRSTRR